MKAKSLKLEDPPRKERMPETMKPQLATLSEHAPEGDDWLSEVKFDGYRVLCRIDDGDVRLFTRGGNDWTNKWKSIADAAATLPVEQAWLDGELVAIDEAGAIRFQALQNSMLHGNSAKLVYYVFDLVFLDGRDYSVLPLLERKQALEKILATQKPNALIRYNDHIVGGAKGVFEFARSHGLEGIIAKRADASYTQSRVKTWLKIKCRRRQEFVIGGFTDAAGARHGFGALLVGVYDADGELRYAGRVGSGFDEDKLKALAARFSQLEQSKSPFVNPPTGRDSHGVHWLKPQLVAEVNFAEWTESAVIRQASFEALREDKPGREIVREYPIEGASVHKGKSSAVKSKVVTSSGAAPQIAGVALTHASRVLFPGVGWTKLDLARYYEDVAEWILPHLKNRPLTLVRCPQGGGKCFFQKHVNKSTSTEMESVKVPEKHGSALYMLANDPPALMRLVQMGVLELHTLGARTEELRRPDRMIFDLDPAPTLAWTQVVEAARLLRALLEELELQSFLKTTGGKGLHIVVPLQPERSWTEVKAFTRAIAEHLATHLPERFTAQIGKAERRGKIFIDYLRNGAGATAVAAYSTRARANAPISTPIAWEELTEDLHSDQFNVGNIRRRLDQLKVDPWKEYFRLQQRLSAAMLKRYPVRTVRSDRRV